MRKLVFKLWASLVLLVSVAATPLCAQPITIVAAESVYGDIAQQIGGPHVHVTSILTNPAQDPHLFEVSPSVAAQVKGAEIVIYNGADYDPWMANLATSSADAKTDMVVVSNLAGVVPGANPHLWYDQGFMRKLAAALAEKLVARDPAHAEEYRQNQSRFEASLLPLQDQIASIAKNHQGTQVAATEPVFFYALNAMGLKPQEQDFERAVMNDTEPSISAVAQFERDLKTKSVKLLISNAQATSPVVDRLLALAKGSAVPVVQVTETEPPGQTYQQWLGTEFSAIAQALDGRE